MFKTILATALISCLSVPAFAAGMMARDDASTMTTEEMAKGMTDPMKKDAMMMAVKEVDSAKMAMKACKTDDCSTHLDNAMKAIEVGFIQDAGPDSPGPAYLSNRYRHSRFIYSPPS